MSRQPFDQETDYEFDRIIANQQDPYRHPGGHTMNQPRNARTSRDQMQLLLGCGGFLLLTALAVAVVLVAWSFL